ncbi:hypothetical protein AGMMS49965_06270 [Bacteroidia bacterium]|nr:hypothetical protein AGMMS49965_06270 [Bacteroidia bacterium]
MKRIVVSLFVILLSCRLSAQTEIWVAPDGSGTAFSESSPGSIEGSDLKDKIMSLRSGGEKDIRVRLLEGVYPLETPITVDNAMAGDAAETLTFTGVATNPCSNEGKAVISGGRKVTTGWQSAGDGIYKAQLPAGAAFRQLYVNGKMAIRARHPNRENDTDYGPYWLVKNFGASNAYMVINSSEIQQWRNMDKIEMVIHQDWVHNRTMVNSFEQRGNNTHVNIRSPLTYWGDTNLPYFWENSLDFLDADGEWYLDETTQELYYKPRTGENIEQIEVIYPTIDRLLTIEGTATNPVQNVTVQNIEFIYSNWTAPSIVGLRSNQAVQPLDGNIQVETLVQVNYAHNVCFTHCNIVCAGANGLTFATGVKNSVIEACRFNQICANGIVIDTYKATQQSAERLCSDNTIAHNLFEHFGTNYANGVSIAAFKVDRLTMEYNEIRYSRYTGLQINNGNDTLHDNTIRYNNIHHVMWLHNDGGGIYTMGYQPGTRIYENWVHDMERGTWVGGAEAAAVFLDDHSSDITVENNVFNSIFAGVQNKVREQQDVGPDRNAHDNHISNNESQDADIMAAAGPKIFPGVITSATQSSDADLSNIVSDAGPLTPAFNTNTVDYTLHVTSDIQKINLLGITTDCNAVILNNPLEKRLAEGNNPITITVMAQDGTTKSYSVDVMRDYAPTLYSVLINGRGVPSKDVMNYTASCSENEVTISPSTSKYCTSEIYADGKPVIMPVALKPGVNRFTIRVMPPENMPSKDYILEISYPLDCAGTQLPTLSSEPVFKVYPNPAQDYITVENAKWESASVITLYNTTGVKVRTHPVAGLKTVINTSNLPAGIYIVESGKQTTTIIIQ